MDESDGLSADLGPDIIGNTGPFFGQEVRLAFSRYS